MSSLAAAFDAGTAAVTATKTWELIEQSQQRLTDPARRELFGSAARRFAQAHGDQLIRVAAWHGDWAPWNMAWVGHQVRLWDWERFAEEVPVGFDALHYLLNVDAKQRGWPTALSRIDEHVELASRAMRMRPAEIAATSPFYLLELCRRYLLAASPDTGRSLRRQADTVLAHCIEMTGGARPVLPDWGTR